MPKTYTKYFSGDTIRIEFEFNDFDGNPIDPANIKITFYDVGHNELSEAVIGAGNKTETGKYFYDYSSAIDFEGIIIYEVYGEINTNPSVKRDGLDIRFMK